MKKSDIDDITGDDSPQDVEDKTGIGDCLEKVERDKMKKMIDLIKKEFSENLESK